MIAEQKELFQKLNRLWRISFLATIFLAVAMLCGWIFDLPRLFQISEGYAPVQFNAALSLLCLCIAFFTLKTPKSFLGISVKFFFGLIPLILGMLTLLEYFLDIDFSIDQFFKNSPILTGVSHPGRISPNSGIAFVCLGFIACTLPLKSSKASRVLHLFLSIMVCVIGTMSLFGYFSGVQAGYHWGEFTQMAPQLAVVMTYLSLVCIARFVCEEWIYSGAKSKFLISSTLAFIIFSATLGVWNALRLDEYSNFEEFMEITTKEFSLESQEAIDQSFRDFLSFVQFTDHSSNSDELKKDISFLMEQSPYIKVVATISDAGNFEWIVNKNARNSQIATYHDQFVNKVFEGIPRSDSELGITNLRYDASIGYLIYSFEYGKPGKNYSRVFQLVDFSELLSPIATEFKEKGHNFTVLQNGEVVFQSDVKSELLDISQGFMVNLQIDRLDWQIIGHPSALLFNSLSTRLPHLIMILGIFAAILTFFLVGFLIELHMREGLLKSSEKALKLSKDKAEDANRSKSEFLANMSHEIRTPLNAITGFTELLVIDCENPSRRKKCVDGILRNSGLLTNLIEDILDLSKIEAGQLTVESLKTSLADVALDISSMLAGKAHEKGIVLEIINRGAVPDTLLTDPTRLRQILLNIVGNAIKYTHEGSVMVTFHTSVCGKLLHVDVKDTGIGISKGQQHLLFRPFSQADPSMTRKYGGTGLGLALSRKLARSLGGDVVLVESDKEQGATFRVSIELKYPENFNWVTTIPNQGYLASKSENQFYKDYNRFDNVAILVVDDALDNRVITASYLKMLGVMVEVAGDGQAAISKIAKQTFDLVFMDLQMPILNGYEATKIIRQTNSKLPIVALTANAMKEEREKCLKSGFSEYVSKPINLEKIHDVVKQFLAAKLQGVSNMPNFDNLDNIQKKVLPIFFETTDERIEKMRNGFNNNERKEISSTAHQIRGVAKTLGLGELGSIATELEESIKQGVELLELRPRFDEFERKYEVAKDAYNRAH